MIKIVKVRCVNCNMIYSVQLKECPYCHDNITYPSEITKTESEVAEKEEREKIINAWENEQPKFKELKHGT